LVENIFLIKKKLGSKKFGIEEKNLGSKVFWVKKVFCVKKLFFGSKSFLGQKLFWSKQFLLVKKVFGSQTPRPNSENPTHTQNLKIIGVRFLQLFT